MRILEDWYAHYLKNVHSSKFGWVDRFGHYYALRSAVAGGRTLEIGPGTGSHLRFEDIGRQTEYVGLDVWGEIAGAIEKAFPSVRLVIGDCQKRIDFPDNYFHRVIAIHVLEHLVDLPAALDQIARVLRQDGLFSAVIPCEGGWAYKLGRRFTTQRMFEKRYGRPYGPIIRYEHVNTVWEILDAIAQRFRTVHRTSFPLRVPSPNLNLVLGLTLSPIKSQQ